MPPFFLAFRRGIQRAPDQTMCFLLYQRRWTWRKYVGAQFIAPACSPLRMETYTAGRNTTFSAQRRKLSNNSHISLKKYDVWSMAYIQMGKSCGKERTSPLSPGLRCLVLLYLTLTHHRVYHPPGRKDYYRSNALWRLYPGSFDFFSVVGETA